MEVARAVCPGRGIPYPELNRFLDYESKNELIGHYLNIYTGHSSVQRIREGAASGGIISHVLIHLLESGEVDGAVVLQQGRKHPEKAEPFIATSREDILSAAQSIYAVTPTLTLLPEMENFDGKLAFVGLPEQVAALRMLQAAGNTAASKVTFIVGPYTGTNMYGQAVRAYLRAQGVPDEMNVTSLKWRAGEWPGYLRIETEDGQLYQAKKFYYNYLIPFYISRNCQIIPDFTNELTDLSVGDAWSPEFEEMGGGHSVIVSRSKASEQILNEMSRRKQIELVQIQLEKALNMHGHMLDFKKRGTFLRLDAQKSAGKPVPDFGYRPKSIPFTRKVVESILSFIFSIGKLSVTRKLVTFVPDKILGSAFDTLRKSWKSVSKPSKRKGLMTIDFEVTGDMKRWDEIQSLHPRNESPRC